MRHEAHWSGSTQAVIADSVSSGWQHYSVDLDAAVAAAGISYNNGFKIKCQQFGQYRIATGFFALNSNGFAFDDIEVVGTFVDLDPDGDGVLDPDDNCPNTANADQTDADGDGYGDECDGFAHDDAEWIDTDSDGIGNNSDPDDDNDGMDDEWESQYGLSPLDASDASQDPDGDGRTNVQEYGDGTDPTIWEVKPNFKEDFESAALAAYW